VSVADGEQIIAQALDQLGSVVAEEDRRFVEQVLTKVYAAGRNAGRRDVSDEVYQSVPRYLVGYRGWSEEYPLALAYVENADAAREAYARRECTSQKFLTSVYGREGTPLLSSLLIRTHEEAMAYIEDGSLPEVDRATFEERVKKFFGKHTEWAERYIAYYYSDTAPEEAQRAGLFSEDMLYYIYNKLYRLDVVALRSLPMLH